MCYLKDLSTWLSSSLKGVPNNVKGIRIHKNKLRDFLLYGKLNCFEATEHLLGENQQDKNE